MRLLILGGTQFLGRAIAARAYAMGHDVTCAARGVAGTVPYRARFIRVDRDEPDGLAPLAGKEFDAVVDVSSWARTAGAPVTGLTADEESAALKAWHASRA